MNQLASWQYDMNSKCGCLSWQQFHEVSKMSYAAAFKWKRDQITRLSSYMHVKQRGFLSGEDILHSLKDEIDHQSTAPHMYASVIG